MIPVMILRYYKVTVYLLFWIWLRQSFPLQSGCRHSFWLDNTQSVLSFHAASAGKLSPSVSTCWCGHPALFWGQGMPPFSKPSNLPRFSGVFLKTDTRDVCTASARRRKKTPLPLLSNAYQLSRSHPFLSPVRLCVSVCVCVCLCVEKKKKWVGGLKH